MLTDPTLEQLLPKASCAYELAVLVSKRASQIVDGAQPMIPDQADNAVSLACKEILEDKVVGVKGNLPKDAYTVPLTRDARLAIEAERKAKKNRNIESTNRFVSVKSALWAIIQSQLSCLHSRQSKWQSSRV